MSNSKPKFIIIKKNNTKSIVYFENDNMLGYDIKPKKNVKLKGAIAVNKMLIANPELIDQLVNKKINRRFKDLINNLSVIYDEDDDENSGSNLMIALNQTEKFRREIYNKYRSYITKEMQLMIEKKLAILENEIKLRLYNFNYNYNNEKEEKRSK